MDNLLQKLNTFSDNLLKNDGMLYEYHMIVIPLARRAADIIEGFNDVIKKNNLTVAIPLLRMQMDNCIYVYGAHLSGLSASEILKTEDLEFRKIKDAQTGRNLTDAYICAKLDAEFKGFHKLYKYACKYVHYSDKIYAEYLLGKYKKEEIEKEAEKCISQMTDITNFLLRLIEKYLINLYYVEKSVRTLI